MNEHYYTTSILTYSDNNIKLNTGQIADRVTLV
jgi:hypothetical protein